MCASDQNTKTNVAFDKIYFFKLSLDLYARFSSKRQISSQICFLMFSGLENKCRTKRSRAGAWPRKYSNCNTLSRLWRLFLKHIEKL